VFTGSGRFEMRNTLRPGEYALCNGLQGTVAGPGFRVWVFENFLGCLNNKVILLAYIDNYLYI
jgi:hypothetical protein